MNTNRYHEADQRSAMPDNPFPTDIEDPKRAEALLAGENRLLEMLATGCTLSEFLDALCRLIENIASGSLCGIVLVDPISNRLKHGAAPSLPLSYNESIHGRPVNIYSGPCAMAAFLKKQVIAADVASDTRWDTYKWRTLAMAHGLRACWSTPIRSSGEKVLGTFAIYSREPGSPSAYHQHLIGQITHLATVAIEHKHREEKLRQDERELRRITDAIAQLICVLGPDGKTLYANRFVLEYSGLSLEDVMADDFRARFFHSDDIERSQNERQHALEREAPFELELRARRKDGQYRWLLIRYNPLRDEEGRIIRWYATGTDIDDRKRAEERTHKENLALREEIDQSSMFEEIVGSSDVIRNILTQVTKVAPSDSTVLVLGETGTGKELIARAIHKRSKRSSRAFITVNCAAIPASLIASELFGHEKGAFTGALQRRLGRFELADGGTIFLDEIGDLPAETQIALLRVLQEGEIERVGGSQPISVDVRVLAATNRDLKAAMAAGTFRQDLFYRLNVFPIQVPPLRERMDDIPLLVTYLIERYAKKAGKKIKNIQKETLELFQAYDWPGNIRELQNVIQRAIVLCESETFSVDETWLKREKHRLSGSVIPLGATLAEQEKDIIEAALADCGGQVSGPTGAAAKLGLPRQTLESKITALGINKHRFKTRQADYAR
ncbi:MAG TPA: sigma 54-interacting transcriptional regulator [Nitrospiraceae bacterium]|nr:sigma 54-interacting transcriptional regulator [Nitrospiraceae bacterium]